MKHKIVSKLFLGNGDVRILAEKNGIKYTRTYNGNTGPGKKHYRKCTNEDLMNLKF